MDINDLASTVIGRYGLECPKCGRDDRLNIYIVAKARLTNEGPVILDKFGSDYDLSSETEMSCEECGWFGELKQARIGGYDGNP